VEDFDIYSDEDLYEEETEDLEADEGSNRTFMFMMIGMAVLLVAIFCVGVGFIYFSRQQSDQDRQAIMLTNEAIIAAQEAGITETVEIDADETPVPTDTPALEVTEEPDTATPTPTPTEEPDATTPSPEDEEEDVTATPAAVADVETPEPSPTRRATPTKPAATSKEMPDTGLGLLGAGILGGGLLFLLALVRRLRQNA